MEYDNSSDRTYAKVDIAKFKTGARVDGDDNFSFLEFSTDAGLEASEWGVSVGAGARAHFFHLGCEDVKVNARFLGGDVKARAGLDFKGFVKEGHMFGAEAKARATLSEAKVGPLNLHLGAGVSTGAKVEDGTVEAKIAGTGLKLGKKIGVTVLDNEFSIDTLGLVGKGWLW
ncbi:unnamed protein product [Porites evermanni]|uniref:Uncharacterized protein n=1 Tax=Porites evermanni TaxID=104178 RepID=A0ABN8PGB3_9CNID|nr:unnamed protein product [Porites evermanni]